MHADAIPDADRAQLRDPAEVAARIVDLLRAHDTPSGPRLTVDVGAPRRERVAGREPRRRPGARLMRPAHTYPTRRDDVRLLVIDPRRPPAPACARPARPSLPELLDAGDLLVVNDAATLPASLEGHDDAGRALEARLVSAADGPADDGERFWAVLFGAGDWRQRTEDRPAPARAPGGRAAPVRPPRTPRSSRARPPRRASSSSRFDRRGDALWAALYAHGRPVQYAYLAHDLPLWAVQTVYAARPWAFEMPSAGRPLSWEILLALRRKGVRWASLTHAAGLSATGDPALDAALPLPERFDIPAATVRAVTETRARGGRVVAVGTTVVRALEGARRPRRRRLRAGGGVTDLRITPDLPPAHRRRDPVRRARRPREPLRAARRLRRPATCSPTPPPTPSAPASSPTSSATRCWCSRARSRRRAATVRTACALALLP